MNALATSGIRLGAGRLASLGGALLVAGLAGCSSRPSGEVAAAPAGAAPAGAAPAGLSAAVRSHFDAGWAGRKWWDDGLAEVATYDAERTIYNKPRRFEYTLITVKEDFNRAFNVKTDDYQRPDLLAVMKVNEFCRIPTDQYPYHYLTSLFFRRDDATQLHKLTTSSQEWCGTTFKAFNATPQGYACTYNSYWDGQGSGQRDLAGAMLFEDGLPYTLRSLRFEQTPDFEVSVCELQQTSKAAAPVIYQARVQVAAAGAEVKEPAWRVSVQLAPGKQNEYWFARAYPNTLLRQTTWDGRLLQLREVHRAAYWQH